MEALDRFVGDIRRELGGELLSVAQFGSGAGAAHPTLSDIDLLIVCKHRTQIPDIIVLARAAEQRIFHTTHSHFTDFLERRVLGSNDFTGVHLIVLSAEEFDRRFHPKSLRLRLLTKYLISKALFISNLRQQHRVLLGTDLLANVPPPTVTSRDRLLAFPLPMLILSLLPLTCWRRREFTIWCCKATKYYLDAIGTYLRLCGRTVRMEDIDRAMAETVQRYRYHPTQYTGSLAKLYSQTWFHLLRNTPFIWRGATAFR